MVISPGLIVDTSRYQLPWRLVVHELSPGKSAARSGCGTSYSLPLGAFPRCACRVACGATA
jgi:hypothetical protein